MNKSIVALSVFLTVLLSPVFADYTADVTFTGANWNNIGNEYPVGTETIYLQVYDSDISGSVDVTVTSDTDTEGEVVSLSEVSDGLFQGSLPVSVSTFRIISDGDEFQRDVEKQIQELSLEHKDWDEERLRNRASVEVYRVYFEKALDRESRFGLPELTSAGDGLLQVRSGDILVLTYEDATDDYGDPVTVTDEVAYGGLSGSVSGVWTSASSPYVVTGDIYVNSSNSLVIEPGVEVKFFPGLGFDIQGYFYAVGTETDSIKFLPVDMSNPVRGMWDGLRFHNNGNSVTLSYFKLAYCGNWSNWPHGGISIWSRHNDATTVIEHGEIYGSSAYGIRDHGYNNSGVSGVFRYLKIHDNDSWGIDDRDKNNDYTGTIDGCEVYNNNGGINVDWYNDSATLRVENSNIHDNGGTEVNVGYIEFYDNADIIFNNNSITDDDGNWLVEMGCCWSEMSGQEVDFRYNDWGENVTAEMNQGNNPKNISRFHDWWDDNNKAKVNYAGWTGGTGNVGYTADVTFTDSNWEDIGKDYPTGTKTIYLQVYDPDVSGSVDVTVSSDTDTEGETVTLTEVSTGLFQGSLPLSVSTFTIIGDNDQFESDVVRRIEELSLQHKDWDEDHLRDRASAEVYRIYFDKALESEGRSGLPELASAGDGVLQVRGGDIMVLTYEDATNDYGNPMTVTDEAVYGGWSGSVSGIWTLANSPYVVTGDIYVNSSNSLVIEPGVVVKFFPGRSFDIQGYFYAVGTEADSIKFLPVNMTNPVRGIWDGLRFHDGEADVTMSYFKVAYGGNWSNWPHGGIGIWSRWDNSVIVIERGEIHNSSGYGIAHYGYGGQQSTVFRYLKIHDNDSWGIDERDKSGNYEGTIDGCEIYNNGGGINLDWYHDSSTLTVSNSNIHDNNSTEIYIGYIAFYDGADVTFNNNNITDDDGNWLVDMGCCWGEISGMEVDFRNNYWGESVTTEMNQGNNPKNISRFHDWWDDNRKATVNYGGWSGTTGTVGYTADLTFTDSNWDDIGNEYAAGTETIYLEVYDPDVSGSVDVTVKSDTDTEGETVTLSEVSTGLFQGPLPVSVSTFRIIGDNDQFQTDVAKRMKKLSLKHRDWDDERLRDHASAEEYQRYFEEALRNNDRSGAPKLTSSSDGVLQVSSGDILILSYEDAMNDYGNPITVTDEAAYGGWSGSVTGVWALSNSPYVVTGDIYVNQNDSLVIEPGVEVKFFPGRSFDIQGYFYAVGTETDSIRFIPVDMDNPVRGIWDGLLIHDSGASVTLSYFTIAYGGNWSNWPNGGISIWNRRDDAVTAIEHGEIYGSSAYGIRDHGYNNSGVSGVFRYLKIHDNDSWGIEDRDKSGNYEGTIDGCEIYNNNGGINVEGYWDSSTMNVINSNIHDNNGTEVSVGYIEFYDDANVFFNNNSITDDDGNWLVDMGCCWSESGQEVDFRSNYWGEDVMAEMNEGDNPKNISRFYDWWDDNRRAIVKYGGWLQHPAVAGVKLSVAEIEALPSDTVLVDVNVQFHPDSSFISAELSFTGYFGELEFIEVDTASSMVGTAQWMVFVNETDSLLITASAGAGGISGEGVLFRLKFVVPDTADGFIQIIPVAAVFNTGEAPVELIPGGVNVLVLTYGDVDWNGKIQAYDAGLILQYLVNYITLDARELRSADVSLDSTISALDATLILKYIVGLIDTLPYEGSIGAFLANGRVGMEDDIITAGQTIDIPIKIDSTDNILSFEGTISYDPSVLTFKSMHWSELTSGFTIQLSDSSGVIKFAGAGGLLTEAAGIFTMLQFTVDKNFNETASTHVTITRLRWNEEPAMKDVFTATLSGVLSIDIRSSVPTEFALKQNFPNPFNTITTIRYEVPKDAHIYLAIYNLLGQEISTLVNETQSAGYYDIQWNGRNRSGHPVSSGVYFMVMQSEGFTGDKKLLLVK